MHALPYLFDIYYIFWWMHQLFKVYTATTWFISMSQGACEKCLILFLGVHAGWKYSHRRALACKTWENFKWFFRRNYPLDIWIHYLRQTRKKDWGGRSNKQLALLIESRQWREPGSVSSQAHPPWPANHCTGDTKLAWRKSQENTKPSAALLNLNEWEKKNVFPC